MLSTPPAFVLSQDQTLVFNPANFPSAPLPELSLHQGYLIRIDCRSFPSRRSLLRRKRLSFDPVSFSRFPAPAERRPAQGALLSYLTQPVLSTVIFLFSFGFWGLFSRRLSFCAGPGFSFGFLGKSASFRPPMFVCAVPHLPPAAPRRAAPSAGTEPASADHLWIETFH